MKVDSWIPLDATRVAEELARRLSHDIRSPVHSGISVLQLVLHELDGNHASQAKDLLASLLENHRQHQWYLDCLLFWSRTELGVYAPLPEAIIPERIWTSLASRSTAIKGTKPLEPEPFEFPLAWFDECADILFSALHRFSPHMEVTVNWDFASPHVSFTLLPEGSDDLAELLDSFPGESAGSRLPSPVSFGLQAASRGFKRMGLHVSREFGRWLFHYSAPGQS